MNGPAFMELWPRPAPGQQLLAISRDYRRKLAGKRKQLRRKWRLQGGWKLANGRTVCP